MRLAEDLEAVADAPHQPACGGELLHRLHERCEAGDRTAAEVIAVGEAAGEDDAVGTAEIAIAMPEHHRLVPVERDGVGAVAVRPGPREDGDAEAHQAGLLPSPTRSDSIA